MNVQVFINESSLHGQYKEHSIEDNIKDFLRTLSFINCQQFKSEVFTTQLFFNVSKAIENQHIGCILERNNTLKKTFFDNIKNISKWENEQIHDSTACYVYEEEDFVGKSIAELAERKLQNQEIKDVLVNFPESRFENKENIEVYKNKIHNIVLHCSFDEDSILRCFIQHNLIDPNQKYDVNCRYSPRDYQTVLNDSEKFVVTKHRNQSRKVFERIGHDQLWTVDNLHYGKDAHIEVFHKVTGEHLGTCPYNEMNIETKYKENGRNLF